jgi:hypothetical protein
MQNTVFVKVVIKENGVTTIKFVALQGGAIDIDNKLITINDGIVITSSCNDDEHNNPNWLEHNDPDDSSLTFEARMVNKAEYITFNHFSALCMSGFNEAMSIVCSFSDPDDQNFQVYMRFLEMTGILP